ncbi:unnamed protein product [Orchesella dallaii]|uniref:Uncharacterized protein n=1 Tax=Orchesella dallaii TaxID=48710 RepID=A0ABP1RDJ4_9HEXA
MRAKVLVCLLALWGQPWDSLGMQVDLYAHKDKFGQSLNMDISDGECTNVPRPWLNVTMSVDTHGSCMQFYDGKSCTGKIAVVQSFHTPHMMDLSLISFHNVIQSISPCGAKVPSGRYVVQSAVDTSILTVSKYENQFAFAHTLPPRAFIPKSQQWEIREEESNFTNCFKWVLRPLLVAPKPTPAKPGTVPEEVKYQVPSRIVDQYLEQQKLLRERDEEGSGSKVYKIKNRRKKPAKEPDSLRARKQQSMPPQPQVFYSRSQPDFLRKYAQYSKPQAPMKYMEGMYPVYDEVKIEDPVFPDFLLHAASRRENEENRDKYGYKPYAVTRPPLRIPLPTGHPSFSPQKPKYDGRRKEPEFVQEQEESEEEEEEDEVEEPEPKTEDQVHDALLRDKEERHPKESEESGEEEEEEDEEEKPEADQAAKEKEAEADSEEDPAVSVAGFMKLLFKGISNKLQDGDKANEEMVNTFERKRR